MKTFNTICEDVEVEKKACAVIEFIATRATEPWRIMLPGEVVIGPISRQSAGGGGDTLSTVVKYKHKGLRQKELPTTETVFTVIKVWYYDYILVNCHAQAALHDIDVERFKRIDKAFDTILKDWGFAYHSSTGMYESPPIDELYDTLRKRYPNDIGLTSVWF